jgi:hypothetical protein
MKKDFNADKNVSATLRVVLEPVCPFNSSSPEASGQSETDCVS